MDIARLIARPLIGIPLPRSLLAKFVLSSVLVSSFSLLYLLIPGNPAIHPTQSTCPPHAWSAGHWSQNSPLAPHPHNFTQPSDVWDVLGLQGCASSREVYWHLAADNPAHRHRFPALAQWSWTPPPDICAIDDFDPAALIHHLVTHGGWYLLGDSVTEGHFFSLSCSLYPHVVATPDYSSGAYGRDWPQHLYLNPSSPLIRSLQFPPAFSIKSTPLVTFRRSDLLLPPDHLDSLYHTLHPNSTLNGSLFSDELAFHIPPAEYISAFADPQANYAAMIVSTGGHWTTHLFSQLSNSSLPNNGIQNIVDFFGDAMLSWAAEVQSLLRDRGARHHMRPGSWPGLAGWRPGTRRIHRQIIARPYLPGHDGCHKHLAPFEKWNTPPTASYNWNEILDMNRKFEAILESAKFPDIHFLPIEMPALLRPDAHVATDCLHIMTGAGVLEGWTHYIWHYLTSELPAGRIR